MRIDNRKFAFSFPKFSAASCQVNFSRRLCYRNVKRPDAASAARPSVGSSRHGIALGSWNPPQELQIAQELEVFIRSGAAIYMRAWSCNFWYTNISYKINL